MSATTMPHVTIQQALIIVSANQDLMEMEKTAA